MSIAHLTVQELACFVAIAHKHLAAGPLDKLAQLMELASSGNAGALSAQYGDTVTIASAAEIETLAREYLGDNPRRDMSADHWAPIAYNMIANDGTAYLAPGVHTRQNGRPIETIHELERKARAWQETQQRATQRAEQNAVAFNEIGQLKVLSAEEAETLKTAARADRVIVAEFEVNESDSQSDYFGGRTTRRVVIGFAKGKRENFKQLRAAAAKFSPTRHMGPGKDVYTLRALFANTIATQGRWHAQGDHSHSHEDQGSGKQFETLEEARAFLKTAGEPYPILYGGELARFVWDIGHESFEHRENYSMGGGNYLAAGRYDGWRVRSFPKLYSGDHYEFFSA